ncbi:DsbA family protein [Phenylobacterium soli]|uniref:DsbA family protein n=1 Tax=Phenylobacterium soli TaxID=2170551 RepID=A0A328AM24_9CAUL|nr:DsbA family protein [Phenylobacterium soli]RAK55481.1 DsbA family protein [Phenylobacterium soli]
MKFALLAAAGAAIALSGCQKADDAAFGKRVHDYLMAHPEVIQQAAQKLQEKQAAEAAKASTDAISKYRAQLERDPRDAVLNPNGKITVVEFFDYRCGYCKLAAPEVVKLVEQNPDVRVVFKQFPIFGEVSDTAAKIALTPAAKAKALPLYKSWMAEKALDEALVDRDLAAVGIDPAQARKAAADPAIERQILDTRALATALKIEGTPAFIVGDTLIPGADLDALRRAVKIARDGGLKTPS